MAECDQAHLWFWLFFPERMMQIYLVDCLQVVRGFFCLVPVRLFTRLMILFALPPNDLMRSLMDSLFATEQPDIDISCSLVCIGAGWYISVFVSFPL